MIAPYSHSDNAPATILRTMFLAMEGESVSETKESREVIDGGIIDSSTDAVLYQQRALITILITLCKYYDVLPPVQQSASYLHTNLSNAVKLLSHRVPRIGSVIESIDIQNLISQFSTAEILASYSKVTAITASYSQYDVAVAIVDFLMNPFIDVIPTSIKPPSAEYISTAILHPSNKHSILLSPEVHSVTCLPSLYTIIGLHTALNSVAEGFTTTRTLSFSVCGSDITRTSASIVCTLLNHSITIYSSFQEAWLAGEYNSVESSVSSYQDLEELYTVLESKPIPVHTTWLVWVSEYQSLHTLGSLDDSPLASQTSTPLSALSAFVNGMISQDNIETVVGFSIRDTLTNLVSLGNKNFTKTRRCNLFVLRGKKQIQQRHRVLFIDRTQTTYSDTFHPSEWMIFSTEEVQSQRRVFQPYGYGAGLIHKTLLVDILKQLEYESQRKSYSVNPLSEITPTDNDDWFDKVIRSHKNQTATHTLFRGIPYNEYAEFHQSLLACGIDMSNYFVHSQSNAVEFSSTFSEKSLLRVGVLSAPSIRNQETRLQYSLAHWWYRNEPLLPSISLQYSHLQQSFSEALYPGLLRLPALRGVFSVWMAYHRKDMELLETKGAREVMIHWLNVIESKTTRYGRDVWQWLSPVERQIAEHILPSVARTIASSTATIESIEKKKSTMNFNGAEMVIDSLLRRGDSLLMKKQPDGNDIRTAVVEARIHELRQNIASLKNRINELHGKAKKHNVRHDDVELIDSTMEIQDELGTIISALVPAQSELRALEHSLKPFHELQERIETERLHIERIITLMLPAIQSTKSDITDENAETAVIDVLRETLHTTVEHAVQLRKEEILRTLEFWWDEYAVR
jgi:hypothetical protein